MNGVAVNGGNRRREVGKRGVELQYIMHDFRTLDQKTAWSSPGFRVLIILAPRPFHSPVQLIQRTMGLLK
jgi:hypothetical protein